MLGERQTERAEPAGDEIHAALAEDLPFGRDGRKLVRREALDPPARAAVGDDRLGRGRAEFADQPLRQAVLAGGARGGKDDVDARRGDVRVLLRDSSEHAEQRSVRRAKQLVAGHVMQPGRHRAQANRREDAPLRERPGEEQ